MVRFFVALVGVLCLTVAAQAADIRGIVKSVDGKTKVTLMVNGVDKTLELSPNCTVVANYQQGRLLRRSSVVTMQVSNGLASVQPNTQVLCTTEMVNGQEVCTQIRLENGTVVTGGRRILR